MGRHRRRARATLVVPSWLIEALAKLEGAPLDRRDVVERIAQGVSKLHRGLTGESPTLAAKDYLRDPSLRSAYRCYYLCANAPKLWPVLAAAEAAGVLPSGPLRVVELGGGPGTGVAAFAAWARTFDRRVAMLSTDALTESGSAARALARAVGFEGLTTLRHDARASVEPLAARGPFDVALIMNLVNELPAEADGGLVRSLDALLAPRGLAVVIEPASREASRRALALRDALCAVGWGVVAPCTHAEPCPARAEPDVWCHGEWRFERPAFVRAVDARVGVRREVLKATWFVAGRGIAAQPGRWRVVSERFDEKGRTKAVVCGAGGRCTAELQKRDRTPSNADFAAVSRHALIEIDTPPGRLSPDATVRCLDEWADLGAFEDGSR